MAMPGSPNSRDGSTKSAQSLVSTASSPSRRNRRFPRLKLNKRSTSLPVDTNDNNGGDAQSEKKRQTTKTQQCARPSRNRRFTKRSKSLPVESVTTCTSNDDNTSNKGPQEAGTTKRTRRRLKLDFLKGRKNRNDCSSKASKSSKGSMTEDLSDEDVPRSSWMDRTRIVTELSSPISHDDAAEERKNMDNEESGEMQGYSCATAILQHSYLEGMCGRPQSFSDHSESDHPFFEDPTVQESIECIFASQLEDGLKLWDEEDDELETLADRSPKSLVSPASVQQSRLNRADRKEEAYLSQSKKRYQQASLLYVGTFDPTIPDEEDTADGSEGPLPCPCSHSSMPSLRPEDWPQAPLLLRPTPGSKTKIKGVRFSDNKDYLWEPGSHMTWSECLAEKWGSKCNDSPRYACCERCAILPINNGNEKNGESMIIDFETELFEGSFMLRLRYSEGTTEEKYDDSKGYFAGMNRRYQAVVRGRFKKSVPLTELVTGFKFNRPCGKLPAKWILRGGMKVLSFFAPQLDAKMEGAKPYSLTPLGSTPQSIQVDSEDDDRLDDVREEPRDASRTLLGERSLASSSLQRARLRKKNFDKLFVQQSTEPRADVSKVYTFEFLQHLFNFQDFSIELGSMLGSVKLEELLDGQPLQIMASHGDTPLWSFDVWHECLWEKAKRHEQ